MALSELASCGSSGGEQRAVKRPEEVRTAKYTRVVDQEPQVVAKATQTTDGMSRAIPVRALSIEQAIKRLRYPSEAVTYAPASLAEQRDFTALIHRLAILATQDVQDVPAQIARIEAEDWKVTAQHSGFALEHWQVDGADYLVVIEAPEHARGSGMYLFRVASGIRPAMVLQAPHSYFEFYIRAIAGRMFFAAQNRGAVSALFINTVHRYQVGPGKREKRQSNPADVAHNAAHLFNRATDAFASATKPLHVVQIHGFHRDPDSQRDADAIIHATVGGDPIYAAKKLRLGLASAALTDAVATELEARFASFAIRRYPKESKVLGGANNVQRTLLIQHRGAAFIHIELSRELRQALVGPDDACVRFVDALLAAAAGHGGSVPE